MTKMLLVIYFFFSTITEVVESEVITDTVICKSNGCETEGNNQSTQVIFSLEQDESSTFQEQRVKRDGNIYTNTGSGSKENNNDASASTTEYSVSLKENDHVITKADENPNIFLTTDTVDIGSEISSLKGNVIKQKWFPENITDSIESTQDSIVTIAEPLEVTSENSFKKNIFSIKQDFFNNIMKNTSYVCLCDLKVNECDINCCCDEDCNANMKQAFSFCTEFEDTSSDYGHNSCFNPEYYLKKNTENSFKQNIEGLFCLVKRNLPLKESQIVKNVTYFKKKMKQKMYAYSQVLSDEPNMSNTSYQGGDYVWSILDNRFVPFGVPDYHFNMGCSSIQYIHFLSDFSTKCLHSIPKSKISCEKAEKLGMKFYLKHSKIVKSPSLIKNSNSSNFSTIMGNYTYCDVIPYICPKGSILNCSKESPRRLEWDGNTCKNIVKSVVYYIYHNGSQGIEEVRAYFFLANVSSKGSSQVSQEIKLKFLWVNTPENRFVRSGNPGYLVGKPIMAGRKIFSSNDTNNLKKEAIDLLVDPKHWLSIFGNKEGICSFNERTPVSFGENVIHSCFIDLNKYDFRKKKCTDLQEDIFHFLLGSDYTDIKLNNKMNKFVGTFGNSRVEETGDWVEVIIDIVPIVSSQTSFTSFNDIIICKDLVTDLFIDIAYSKIGSFQRPQYKIIGVNFYFGSSKKLIYSDSLYYTPRKTLKISAFVNFIDLTTGPEKAFAEIPGLEAKFPHDFFYPFFSRATLMTQSSVSLVLSFIVYFFSINYVSLHVVF